MDIKKITLVLYFWVMTFIPIFGQSIDSTQFYKGLLHKKQGNYEQSIQAFSSFIHDYPHEFPKVYLERGYTFIFLKRYEEALQDFTLLKQLEPNNHLAPFALGRMHSELGHYETAIPFLDQALSIQPFDAQCLNYRGVAKCKIKDFDSAIKDFIKATEIDSSFAMAFNNAGAARYYNQDIDNPIKKDIENAVSFFSKAIDNDPTLSLAFRNRGAMYLFLGFLDQALNDLTKAGNLEPQEALIPFYKAVVLREKTLYKESHENLDKALELNPRFYFAYEEKGDLFIRQKRWKDAIQEFSKAKELSQNSSYQGLMHYKMALVHAHQKNKALMYSNLKTAKKLGAFKDITLYNRFHKKKAFHPYRKEKKFKKFVKGIRKIEKEHKFIQSELIWFRMYD